MFIDRAEINQTSEFAGMDLEAMRRELIARIERLGLGPHLGGLLEGPNHAAGNGNGQDEES